MTNPVYNLVFSTECNSERESRVIFSCNLFHNNVVSCMHVINCFAGKGIQRELESIYSCTKRIYNKKNYVGRLVFIILHKINYLINQVRGPYWENIGPWSWQYKSVQKWPRTDILPVWSMQDCCATSCKKMLPVSHVLGLNNIGEIQIFYFLLCTLSFTGTLKRKLNNWEGTSK